MGIRRNTNIVGAIMGLALGPFSLPATATAKPPLTWTSIEAGFLFGIVAGVFFLGIGWLRRHSRRGGTLRMRIERMAIFMTCMGIGASTYSIYRGTFGPPSVIFLAIGMGLVVALLVSMSLSKARLGSSD